MDVAGFFSNRFLKMLVSTRCGFCAQVTGIFLRSRRRLRRNNAASNAAGGAHIKYEFHIENRGLKITNMIIKDKTG
jgi:hypothetical protein